MRRHTHTTNSPCATGSTGFRCATGSVGFATVPVSPASGGAADHAAAARPPRSVPSARLLRTPLVAGALLALMALLGPLAGPVLPQNALQQFAACMAGPSLATGCGGAFDVDASSAVDVIDALAYQPDPAGPSATDCGAPGTRYYDGVHHQQSLLQQLDGIVGAIVTRGSRLCTGSPVMGAQGPAPNASMAYIAVGGGVLIPGTLSLQAGFIHCRGFTSKPGGNDLAPVGEARSYYVEMYDDTNLTTAAHYQRVWKLPPDGVVQTFGDTVFYVLTLQNIAQGKWAYSITNSSQNETIGMGSIETAGWRNQRGTLAALAGETFGLGDKMPGSASAPVLFTETVVVRQGQTNGVPFNLDTTDPQVRVSQTSPPIHKQAILSISPPNLTIWDARP